MPRFSIVIPCFNASATIEDTLMSMLGQTLSDFEVICVDDGSTDETRDIIHTWAAKDSRVQLVANTGKGPSDARNFGALEVASGDILAFCDADDLWAPTKLARLNAVFADPSVDAAYSRIAFFQEDPRDATTESEVPKGDLTIGHLLGENPVCTMSNIALRRDAFQRTGGFDPSLVHNEDLEWLIRLVGGGARVVSVEDTLTYYRRTLGGLSTDLPAMLRGRDAALRTAARFGCHPDDADQAIFLRYLARRALRMGQNRCEAARFALRGVWSSPSGFFSSPRRGALTLGGALAALVLPRRINHVLFSR